MGTILLQSKSVYGLGRNIRFLVDVSTVGIVLFVNVVEGFRRAL